VIPPQKVPKEKVLVHKKIFFKWEMTMERKRPTYMIDVVHKAGTIIKYLIENQSLHRLSNIAAHAGITQSRTLRLLSTLVICGFVWQWKGLYQIHPGFKQSFLDAIMRRDEEEIKAVKKVLVTIPNIDHSQNGKLCRFDSGKRKEG
jgi:hypothetical protein